MRAPRQMYFFCCFDWIDLSTHFFYSYGFSFGKQKQPNYLMGPFLWKDEGIIINKLIQGLFLVKMLSLHFMNCVHRLTPKKKQVVDPCLVFRENLNTQGTPSCIVFYLTFQNHQPFKRYIFVEFQHFWITGKITRVMANKFEPI